VWCVLPASLANGALHTNPASNRLPSDAESFADVGISSTSLSNLVAMYEGMSVNERLQRSGNILEFYKALRADDVEELIRILMSLEYAGGRFQDRAHRACAPRRTDIHRLRAIGSSKDQ
jgi:hypothetical protein